MFVHIDCLMVDEYMVTFSQDVVRNECTFQNPQDFKNLTFVLK